MRWVKRTHLIFHRRTPTLSKHPVKWPDERLYLASHTAHANLIQRLEYDRCMRCK